ncbi:MAG: DinB family protein [Rhizomicrobium sp.]
MPQDGKPVGISGASMADGMELLSALDDVLAQGEHLLKSLSDGDYEGESSQAPETTIGAHYRHSLEHFQMIFEAVAGDEIDYDRRARDPVLERERSSALALTQVLRQRARFLHAAQLQQPIVVRCQTGYGEPVSAAALSSFGREAMYVIFHAIHHYALIAMICAGRGIAVPGNFGMAPSTLRYRRQSAAG